MPSVEGNVDSISRSSGHWKRAGKAALAVGVALAAFAVAFDWNWFRPALERQLSAKSHRSVQIDDFHVDFSWSLDPTFRLRGVKIENAPWADARPFIAAGELTATCLLTSLLHKRPVITRLVLVDADIDLERQADGLRNWRLTRPDDRGPGIIQILALEPLRSRIRFVHRGIGLDIQTAAAPMEPSARSPLTTKIDFDGSYGGAKFNGEALTGHEVTFQRTGRLFPVRGHAVSGHTRLDVDGSAADAFKLSSIDADVALKGPSLAQLRPFAGKALSESPPYTVSGHLKKDLARSSIFDAHLKVGSSDLAGVVTLDLSNEQSVVRATLHSMAIRLEDVAWIGHSLAAVRPRGKVAAIPLPAALPASSAARLDPQAAFADPKRIVDALLQLQVQRLTAASGPVVSNLELTAHLVRSVLTVSPLAFGLAGGRATGRLTFDANESPPASQIRIDMRDMRIEKLLPALPEAKRVTGGVKGGIDLTARGSSLDELLGTASGSISARMLAGSMSKRLDAELGLSGSRLLRALLSGEDRVSIKCAAADFELRAGRGRFRTLLLDTERTNVDGAGTIDLKSREFDLLLTPYPDRPGVFELRKSIRVQGNPGHIAYSLAEPRPAGTRRRCLE